MAGVEITLPHAITASYLSQWRVLGQLRDPGWGRAPLLPEPRARDPRDFCLGAHLAPPGFEPIFSLRGQAALLPHSLLIIFCISASFINTADWMVSGHVTRDTKDRQC